MSAHRQNEDGSWSPAEPIGWMEEHNRLQRLVFWIRGIEHCTAEAEAAYAARLAAKRRTGSLQ